MYKITRVNEDYKITKLQFLLYKNILLKFDILRVINIHEYIL